MSKDIISPEILLPDKFGIDNLTMEKALSGLLSRKVDYADLYLEYVTSESLNLEEGLVKNASRNITQGVGVRAIAGEKTGYAYSDDVSLQNIQLAARTAGYIATESGNKSIVSLNNMKKPELNLYPLDVYPTDVPVEAKVRLLDKIDGMARAYDSRIRNVLATFTSQYKVILVVTSEGLIIGDIQPMCRLNVTCIAEDGGNRQIGSFGGGGRVEFSYFFDENRYALYTRRASKQALINLEAVDTPAGTMDIVLGSGWPGILLHEAIGHGLEADFNRKRTSAFTDMIGKKVASDLCTVIDDGTIPGRRGSINVDDEGIEASRTVLIENGILRGYLQDRLNAKLMKMPLTGNGRRESYAHHPMPRMTNTFMLQGDSTPVDIIRSVRRGLYAVSFGGGQVDITNGKFVFTASEAYLIEDGKVTTPVRGATLIGNGPDVLKKVSMVGNDLELDSGIGTCGKDGQSVPCGVGMPTIKIDGMTVGGTV
ncbi:MAG TPA: metalloprotease TldD [Nitrospirota bacterium]|nr:metalloprotease TldD [Nitrospirota bacterium]